MSGNFTQHGIQQRFCIKDNAAGGSEFWPEGKYCIYKKGDMTTNTFTAQGYINIKTQSVSYAMYINP